MDLSQMQGIIKGLSKEEMLTALNLLQETIDSHLEQPTVEAEAEVPLTPTVLSPEVEKRIIELIASTQRTGQPAQLVQVSPAQEPAGVSWQHVASLTGAALISLACFFFGRYNNKTTLKKKK